MPQTVIYHLVPLSELRSRLVEGQYTPQRFAQDGFVHCAETPVTTVAVANDYFADLAEPLAVLKIDPLQLSAPVKFEAPAPLPGGDVHLKTASLFPHIYGPIEIGAITSAALLQWTDNQYAWPDEFHALAILMDPSITANLGN